MLRVQEESFARVGMGLAQGDDSSAVSTREGFADNRKFLPTSPKLRAGRRERLAIDGAEFRQCTLGQLCWVAPISRPDICARSANTAPRINSLRGSDVRRINELAQAAKE